MTRYAAVVQVVGLLPVRNGAEVLPACLASLAQVCDAVVALDDGSIDDTADVLHGSDLVRMVLTTPKRDTYLGWDDGANRNRLLAAADDLDPTWIVSLDADERLDPTDASALRRFLATDAIGGCAYGLQCFGIVGGTPDGPLDGVAFNPHFTWVYRVFAYRSGQHFPALPMNFNPVPIDLPVRAWVKTTLRVQHLEGAGGGPLARLAKYREADPSGEFADYYERERPALPEDLPRWRPRPPGTAVLLPTQPLARDGDRMGAGRLVCLLPARNAAHDLPDYLESVERFADAVVALDDGSTDSTRDVLASSPLVQVLLSNPRREGYAGWNDSANRNQLLGAAGALEPDWVMFLDADERLAPDDASALRAFVAEEAVPGFVYGFRVHRMIEGLQHYDRDELMAFRLFAFEPGQAVPDAESHGLPVPTGIPLERLVPTTIRIQHLAGLTEERRQSRFEKYREADPTHTFQTTYENLLEPPGPLRTWEPRPAGAPALDDEMRQWMADYEVAAELDLDAPLLSAIVISRDDAAVIERTVRSVVGQECPEPFEVIVVTSGRDRTAQIVRERFPGVQLVELPSPALPGAARNAGLRVARGDYVSFPGSHVELPPGSLAARLRAHQAGYAMVTGTMLNGTHTRAGWASYFLDNSHCLPGRPSGPLQVAPARCSYERDALLRVGGFPEDMRAGEETVVNGTLHRLGYKTGRSQEIVLTHHSPCRTPATLLRHHFQRGRGAAQVLLRTSGEARLLTRALLAGWLVDYVPARLEYITGNVARWGGDLRPAYSSVYPLVVAGAVAYWIGFWYDLLRPAHGKLARLFGRRPFPSRTHAA